jgi:hypothetical protein
MICYAIQEAEKIATALGRRIRPLARDPSGGPGGRAVQAVLNRQFFETSDEAYAYYRTTKQRYSEWCRPIVDGADPWHGHASCLSRSSRANARPASGDTGAAALAPAQQQLQQQQQPPPPFPPQPVVAQVPLGFPGSPSGTLSPADSAGSSSFLVVHQSKIKGISPTHGPANQLCIIRVSANTQRV